MPDKTARGRFVWHELLVPDAAKAHAFYAKVVGWKTQAFEQDPSYQMFAASSGPLGGTVAHSESPPHWLTFIGTTDIDATVRKAKELGARVVSDVAPIANGGKWARLTDPQGSDFAVYQSTQKPGRERQPKRGEFSWHELMTTDYKAAFEFYSQLFGWEKTDEVQMEGLGVYFMFGRNGMPLGGIYNISPQMPGSPSWTGYIRVKDVHKAVKKAKGGGATLITGPMEVPGGDWIAVLTDPQGAMFAVHTLKDDLAPPADAGADAGQPKPQQGTLDFPPVHSATPEKVAVIAKKPAPKAEASAKSAKAAAKAKAPVKKAAKKAARKKAAPKKVSKKAAPKKGAAKKSAASKKKKAVAPKRAKKVARRVAPKKKARRAK